MPINMQRKVNNKLLLGESAENEGKQKTGSLNLINKKIVSSI